MSKFALSDETTAGLLTSTFQQQETIRNCDRYLGGAIGLVDF
jgi:hypothetical protein